MTTIMIGPGALLRESIHSKDVVSYLGMGNIMVILFVITGRVFPTKKA